MKADCRPTYRYRSALFFIGILVSADCGGGWGADYPNKWTKLNATKEDVTLSTIVLVNDIKGSYFVYFLKRALIRIETLYKPVIILNFKIVN
jgi:hypothetical protein